MGVFTPRLCLAPASNDQCKQFNNANSYHQHRKRYRIVIEPMPPLHIHDAAPVLRFASAGTKSCSFSLSLHFELLDERGKTAGERSRGSVILGLEGAPNGPEPSASVGNRNRPVSRGRIDG